MEGKIPYEMPVFHVVLMSIKDVIATSIVDNDGDYRDWENEGEAW